MFTHYLVTRFNIKISENGPERMNSPEVDETWLKNRTELFLRFCAPSVLQQKNTNFTWLLYFDMNTPPFVLDRIDWIKTGAQKIEFIFVADFDHMLAHLKNEFNNASSPYVISTRLDNDDVIGDQFIQSIQDAFLPESNIVININAGFVYDLQKKVLTRWRNKFTNQFGSLIESTSSNEFKTIYGFPHWGPPKLSRTILVLKQPCWIEVIHAANNRARGSMGIPVFSGRALDSFPATVRVFGISFWNSFRYTLSWFPAAVFKRIRRMFK